MDQLCYPYYNYINAVLLGERVVGCSCILAKKLQIQKSIKQEIDCETATTFLLSLLTECKP